MYSIEIIEILNTTKIELKSFGFFQNLIRYLKFYIFIKYINNNIFYKYVIFII